MLTTLIKLGPLICQQQNLYIGGSIPFHSYIYKKIIASTNNTKKYSNRRLLLPEHKTKQCQGYKIYIFIKNI